MNKHSLLHLTLIGLLFTSILIHIIQVLPHSELLKIKNLLITDSIRAYPFFGILMILLILLSIAIYLLLYFLINFSSKKIFYVNINDSHILSVMVTLCLSIASIHIIDFINSEIISIAMNPFLIINVIILFVFLKKQYKNLGINHIIYILFCYMLSFFTNLIITGGVFHE